MEKHKMWAVPAGWRVGMLSGVQRRKIDDSEVNYDCFYITNDISVMCVCARFYGHRNTVTVKSCAYTFQRLRWNFTVNVTNCAYTFFCYDFRFYVDRHRNRKILVAHTLYYSRRIWRRTLVYTVESQLIYRIFGGWNAMDEVGFQLYI